MTPSARQHICNAIKNAALQLEYDKLWAKQEVVENVLLMILWARNHQWLGA